ncbi:hypothetical protein [Kitasatospora sp. NPDC090091]|uniref:hypothetical protein n=1 Tax=Kitasatospora sp. NPDC090091 TaxID=3364081 RepID=UPI00381165D1
MRYVLAASAERTTDACRRALQGRSGVEFRVGSVPETGSDCDAAIFSFPLAHERYGGIPRPGAAQLLENQRDDGVPGLILATPPAPPRTSAGTGEEVEEHSFHVLSACATEFLREFPELGDDAMILIHMEAAGIDHRNIDASLRGVLRFLSQDRPASGE